MFTKTYNECKSVCDVKPGRDPRPLLALSWKRWWPDFITFTACKKSRFSLKKVQCISNKCKDLFKRKNILGLGALKQKAQGIQTFVLLFLHTFKRTNWRAGTQSNQSASIVNTKPLKGLPESLRNFYKVALSTWPTLRDCKSYCTITNMCSPFLSYAPLIQYGLAQN